jgi:LPS export ABC transporter protein LptC
MSCKGEKTPSDETPSISEKQAIEMVTIVKTQKGKLEMILKANFAFIDDPENIAHLRVPIVKFYDRRGKHISTFIAESADVDMEIYDIKGHGKCVVNSLSYGTLETRDLMYNAKKNNIYTSNCVKIIRHGETIYGTSLESDVKLEKIIIRDPRIILDKIK